MQASKNCSIGSSGNCQVSNRGLDTIVGCNDACIMKKICMGLYTELFMPSYLVSLFAILSSLHPVTILTFLMSVFFFFYILLQFLNSNDGTEDG